MTYRKNVRPALAALGLAALALTACSSAGSSSAGSGPTSGRAPAGSGPTSGRAPAGPVTVACQQVSAVLADGPDPDSDPVGYAEAQITPLHRIQTQNPALRDAIGKLAGAYQEFFSTSGTKTAKEAVSVASSAISKICPGATS